MSNAIQYRSRPLAVAEHLLAKYSIERPPVPSAIIVYDYPIEVNLRDWNEDISGIFVRASGFGFIGLNQNHSIERRHFTLFHELYHFLEHTSIYFCQIGSRVSMALVEREADLFAVNILMPEQWVRESFIRYNGNIVEMAKLFTVSKQAMNRRVKDLRLI